ncbi:MAG: trehalase family glycosidase [Salinibacter sp.]|uniref:trehalase family glycosidase n=1 Tax=Salinibacter sp. TaxID=2065818 RepID=UPI002FC32969
MIPRVLHWRRLAVVLLLVVLVAGPRSVVAQPAPDPTTQVALPAPDQLDTLRAYIDRTWGTLTRSHEDLLKALPDDKVDREPGTPWPLYVAASEDTAAVGQRLRRSLTAEEWAQVDLKVLPETPREHMDQVEPHGLLYLPHPYVVPGGRFNEMYGWDSYFISVGLLEAGRVELAKHMTDNHLYQVRHYGTVLNANRTYYLTRSQPPFLATMVRNVFAATRDTSWLADAVPVLTTYYEYWTTGPHRAGDTGLSRYYGLGDGPAPEVVMGERDAEGQSHYDRIRAYYRTNDVTAYDESLFYDAAADSLTALFYKADRSMRESGFDPSNRFGPFNVGIVHHAPVGLNSFLYRYERDVAALMHALGRSDAAKTWTRRAEQRKRRMDELMWNAEAGRYRDYNFRTDTQNDYHFATMMAPLWVGLAADSQAAATAETLWRLEAPGGVLTSTRRTGNQWDAPFGWAPLQMMAVEGLRRYGYGAAADRLSAKFVGLVHKEFQEHGVILEKYDLVQRESDVSAGIQYGYSENVIGFGWTNAVVLRLLQGVKR